MKNVFLTLALVALFAAPAFAANGNLSNDMLSKMGLSGLQAMSDAQGTAVRGLGFVSVSLSVHLVSDCSYVDLKIKATDCGPKACVEIPAIKGLCLEGAPKFKLWCPIKVCLPCNKCGKGGRPGGNGPR